MTFLALFIIAAFGSGIFSLSKFLYRSADDFDNYKKENPNLVLNNGTVICKYCNSRKSYIRNKEKICQTCGKRLYYV